MGAVEHVVVTAADGRRQDDDRPGDGRVSRLGVADSDTDIETSTGSTVCDLRDREGVDAMHRLEAAQLLDALAHEPSVISAAASVVDAQINGS